MVDYLNVIIARMTADVEAVFGLFGDAASQPSLFVDELIDEARAGDAPGDTTSPSEWVPRAAHLIRTAAEGSDAVVYRCSAHAFDDADTRVRGLAWCLLSEMQESAATEDTVNAIIAAAFKERVAAPPDYPERDEDAAAFAVIVGATVLCASGDQVIRALEREYIDMHGGADAWAMEASPTAALGFLDHYDRSRRLAALRVAARARRGDVETGEAIYQRVIADTDPDVQVAALVAYTDLFEDTCDPKCLRRTAAIVLDEQQPMFHRFVAYCSLFKVCGRPFDRKSPLRLANEEELSRLRAGAFDATWPVAVDWDFVRLCALGQER